MMYPWVNRIVRTSVSFVGNQPIHRNRKLLQCGIERSNISELVHTFYAIVILYRKQDILCGAAESIEPETRHMHVTYHNWFMLDGNKLPSKQYLSREIKIMHTDVNHAHAIKFCNITRSRSKDASLLMTMSWIFMTIGVGMNFIIMMV